MLTFGLVLCLVAFVLAWPAPEYLARRSSKTDPIALIILWQAVGLAGGLSLLGAAVLIGLAPIAHTLTHSNTTLSTDLEALAWWHWLLLIVALLIFALLVGTLVAQWIRGRQQRLRHTELVALLSEPSADSPDTRVIRSPEPLAYCVPGRGRGTTVISTGLIDALEPAQRLAVLAHEKAHLRFHHDVLVLPFAAWQRALPLLPATTTALSAVSAIIEFMADDRARFEVGSQPLAEAMRRTEGIHPGETSSALTAVRLARLSEAPPVMSTSKRLSLALMSAALLLTPLLVLVIGFLRD